MDVGLIRSFGRKKSNEQLGLSEKQQEFLVALVLWKVQKLLASPFRFRSGCHLRCASLKSGEQNIEIVVDIKTAITQAAFRSEKTSDARLCRPIVTDVFWPRNELYREGKADEGSQAGSGDANEEQEENT